MAADKINISIISQVCEHVEFHGFLEIWDMRTLWIHWLRRIQLTAWSWVVFYATGTSKTRGSEGEKWKIDMFIANCSENNYLKNSFAENYGS